MEMFRMQQVIFLVQPLCTIPGLKHSETDVVGEIFNGSAAFLATIKI
jgi:hypothetical protein